MKKKNLFVTTLVITALAMGSLIMESASAFGTRVFSVTRVDPHDHLNVREEAGTRHDIIATIPADAEGVVTLGDSEKIGRNTWVKVAWGPIKGWVNKRYLKPSEAENEDEDEDEDKNDQPQYRSRIRTPDTKADQETKLECGGIKPFWNIDVSEDDINVNIKDDHYTLPVTSRRKITSSRKSFIVKGRSGKDSVKLYFNKDNSCKDGITNIKYPFTVKAVINGYQSYSGCCNLAE